MATQIIAHRGASHDAPENTLAALELAWEQGADAAEVDVRLSRDGHIIVCHDSNTLRTTGRFGKLSDLTLDQIRSLDAGSWKGNWQGEKIPTLEEVLANQPPDKQLVIEIKSDPSILQPLQELLKHTSCPHENLFLIGFDIATMQKAKQLFPHIQVLLLFKFDLWIPAFQKRWLPQIESLIVRAKKVNADGLNLSYTHPDDLGWIEKTKAAHLKAFVWTVDDPRAAQHLVDAEINGITTNRPGWIRTQLTGK